MDRLYIIYHGSCMDGFGSAFSAWMHYRKTAQKPVYLAARHGDPFPVRDEEIKNSEVFIADFSFSKEVLSHVHGVAKNVTLLDHHKTAAAQLQGLQYCYFDMNRSGAMITWEYFHGRGSAPKLIHYIQDRDLWRFALPYSREVNAVVQSYPIREEENFVEFEKLMLRLEDPAEFQRVVSEGRAILRFQEQFIQMAIARSVRMIRFEGYEVPAVNTSIFESEICHRLLEIYRKAPFVATYYMTGHPEVENYSLRSRGDFDVSELASRWGGGGHAAAAGFQKKKA